jgi:hypothetical protein
VLAPGIGRLNLGLVQAHKLLTQLRTEGTMDTANANPARDLLAEAVERYPDRTEIRRTLAGLRAAMGSYQRATEAVEAVVALDAQDPLGRYAPWVLWERKLQNAPDAEPWEDLEWVYSHWLTRFPERAEVYVQTALLWEVHKEDVARARSVLEAGLARDAQPSGWLADSLTQLE